ncbi:hypothetical protein [Microtetraspora malaysiensis]|uniref:hypothetical protein n=1 Tax=Microtetraspora malaysiensis TaxID=161358 RepID=UPI003D8FBA42
MAPTLHKAIDPDGRKAKKVTVKMAKMLMTMKTAKTMKLSVKSASSGKCQPGTISCDAKERYQKCGEGGIKKRICQDMKNDYVSCRKENRVGNVTSGGKTCKYSADSYLDCRLGKGHRQPHSGRSDGVCSGAEREVRRCQLGNIYGSRGGYGLSADGCQSVRYDYYSCRADKRGDDEACSTFAEVSYKCKLHRNVQCLDLEGKFLSCYSGGNSPNECAFGVNMLFHCRDSANRGALQDKNTCGNTWNTFMKECQGSDGLRAEICTKGKSWQDVSYSICEKITHGRACVAYLSPKDAGNLGKGGDLPMVIVGGGLGICAAVLSVGQPVAAVGCGVVGSIVGLINGIVQNVQQSKIDDARNGSKGHGEEGGIQVIIRTWDCQTMGATTQCGWLYEHVYHTEYAPL